jgi:Predicted AAA-ATPase/PD-(D/E)XK nuclease superfamily
MQAAVRKKLPIGIQNLAEIIQDGHYYVDKTGFAHQLITEGKYYFLSRPRRFGKSLFLDTLKEIFEGNQALFTGLIIHDKWDWATRFPVIRISFNDGGISNRAELERRIRNILRVNFQHLGLACPDLDDTIDAFGELIRTAHKAYGQRVVVLVDEYDKPLLDNIDDPASALAIREGLKALYSVIKGADEAIRFAFVTGISKFSKVSMFSGMNNLNDLTLYPAYSAICGYTELDLDQVFAPELVGLARDEIRDWYNGYNWRGQAVYNPYDVLLLCQRREFQPWWFETGTPGFLVKLMAERGFFTPDLARLRSATELISSFDIDQIAPEALLFQSGYLTIKEVGQRPAHTMRFTLGYPNREVEISLNTFLLRAYTDSASRSEQHRSRLEDLLLNNDVAAMAALFQAFFASIPYNWYTNNKIAQYEGYYASVFYSYFAALGFDLRVEDATNHGRIDMALLLPAQIYLFEFKVVELLPEGRALQQLQDKAYADKYRALGLPVSLIGVEFSRESRNVVGFEVAQLG